METLAVWQTELPAESPDPTAVTLNRYDQKLF
jgi:hypothetical protein